jgi:hypothetical protein
LQIGCCGSVAIPRFLGVSFCARAKRTACRDHAVRPLQIPQCRWRATRESASPREWLLIVARLTARPREVGARTRSNCGRCARGSGGICAYWEDLDRSDLDRSADKSKDSLGSRHMRNGLAYLLTIALAAHASLGCCWHQGPGCDQCDDSCSQPVCKHHHDHPSHCPRPCKCRLECQGVCNVVCPKKTELAKATLEAPLGLIAALPAGDLSPSFPNRRAASLDATGFGRPLRAHLLLCVLLI